MAYQPGNFGGGFGVFRMLGRSWLWISVAVAAGIFFLSSFARVEPGQVGIRVNNIAGGVYGVVFRGRRYDTGDRLDYIKAIVQLAVERPDLGPDLKPWLKQFSADLD